MALTEAEVESLRFHLGYGNVDVGAYPYTPDGFKELFDGVVAPNLTGSTETTATTAVAASSVTTVTPGDMTGIVVNARLVVDVGDSLEIVAVRSITSTTFTASFAQSHPASGYPIALLGGQARLRMLLHQADKAWQAFQDASVGDIAGLKSVDKGDVVWKDGPGSSVLSEKQRFYDAIVSQISRLVRVDPAGCGNGPPEQTLESY